MVERKNGGVRITTKCTALQCTALIYLEGVKKQLTFGNGEYG